MAWPPTTHQDVEDAVGALQPAVAALQLKTGGLVPGNVYNADGSLNLTKRLHIKLSADGTDIDDLYIETVS